MSEEIKENAVEVEAKVEEQTTADVEPVTEVEAEEVKTVGFFGKLKTKAVNKFNETKYNMEVSAEINKTFSENATRFSLIDQGVKGVLKPLLEVNEEAQTFKSLGKANFKVNTLLKDKEGKIFKITERLEDETRVFNAKDEEFERVIETYTYKEV